MSHMEHEGIEYQIGAKCAVKGDNNMLSVAGDLKLSRSSIKQLGVADVAVSHDRL